ncbi:holo-ACP synthase [Candidatus Babeliales bacterium]|nr:holo-ACP synthase [Candidatus Babeliales bacterium]
MIIGLGLDTVEIERFEKWHTYKRKQLARIFSKEEIDYCLQYQTTSAERFAVRFAAKEALFKAANTVASISFLHLCKMSNVHHDHHGQARMTILDSYYRKLGSPTISISLTHSRTIASAIVILDSSERANPLLAFVDKALI